MVDIDITGYRHYGFYRNGYGNNYYIGHYRHTWREAKRFCRRLWGRRGRLARIDSLNENNWLYRVVGRKNTWIGGNDRIREGQWKWSDNCSLRFNRWDKMHRNINHKRRDCAYMVANKHGKWKDNMCRKRFSFICKKIKPNYICGEFY